jgi:hypothetical protein
MRQKNERLSLSIEKMTSIQGALRVLRPLLVESIKPDEQG